MDEPRRFAVACVVVTLIALGCLGCDSRTIDEPAVPKSPTPQAGPPNLILLSIDTLRRDHLPIYGYDRNTSPNLLEFSKRAVTFDSAITTHTNTAPAHATMMTGKYPGSHGIYNNRSALRDDVQTLAELLGQHGYRTGAFLSGMTLSQHTKLQRGFEVYDAIASPKRQRRAKKTWAKAGPWLREVAKTDSPLFLFLHFYDPHNPYDPPAGFGKAFGQRREFQKGQVEHVRKNYTGASHRQRVDELISRYDGEIAYADHFAGKLLTELEELGRMENTMVIFTSDHGETLFERDWVFDHGCQLYDEQVRVPLVIRFPGDQYAGMRVEAQVSHVDLMATILETLGIDPPELYEGRSLVSLVAGKKDATGNHTTPAFSIARLRKKRLGSLASQVGGGKFLTSARTLDYKLVAYPAKDGGWLTQLFDLRADPEERENLVDKHPEQSRELAAALEQWRTSTQFSEPQKSPELSPELQDSLRSLGYIE